MRFSILAIASALASVVDSQTIQQDTAKLPSCSLSCLSNAITTNDCSITDYVCQCGPHRAAISQAATPCIVASCNTTEALTVQKIVLQICSLALAGVSSSTSGGSPAATGAPVVATSSTVSGMGSQMVSSMGSSMYSVTTATGATPASTTPASSSSSNPAQPSQGAGSRLEAAGAMAVAAFLFSIAL
ncbi:hypothetical protein NA56DRAFT_699216 [Hyaloscypha hepaticicola]|uniref:CFEM domain-containing protein n=1 Tax=Hyaloscypha hepaticicola TaxID=2082293 RepID=A0A2J6QGA0_9HELO|nr:hypothetical protein NA56DRAFT_699216 [Hyaloscypha hepaticicola]